jgi:uncharacterized membrane protein
VVNGVVALVTALWASDAVWTLYNGFIAYIAMAVLFAGEWLIRPHMKARFEAAAARQALAGVGRVKDVHG